MHGREIRATRKSIDFNGKQSKNLKREREKVRCFVRLSWFTSTYITSHSSLGGKKQTAEVH
jgi:hypothetical protein